MLAFRRFPRCATVRACTFRSQFVFQRKCTQIQGARFHLTIAARPEVREIERKVRDAVWQSVLEQRSSTRIQLFAACLMPDHLHMLAGPAGTSVLAFVQQWKSWSTRLAWEQGHKGPLWQPGVWDRGIRRNEQFERVCRYVLDNPVKAGLAADAADWPWSWGFWMDEPLR
jgi:REP element-mobilizing transposase RayT